MTKESQVNPFDQYAVMMMMYVYLLVLYAIHSVFFWGGGSCIELLCFVSLFNGTLNFVDYSMSKPSISKNSKVVVGDCIRERPEGSLFNSYYTEL